MLWWRSDSRYPAWEATATEGSKGTIAFIRPGYRTPTQAQVGAAGTCFSQQRLVALVRRNHDFLGPISEAGVNSVSWERDLFGASDPSQMHIHYTTILYSKQRIIGGSGTGNWGKF